MELTIEKLYEEYITNDKKVTKIAEEYGLTDNQIRGRLKRNGIRKTPLKLGNEKYDNRKWLHNEYITKQKGYTVIANELGVSYTTIISRIFHFGWELRGHNDIDKGQARRGKKASQETIEKIKKTRVKNRTTVSCKQCGEPKEVRMSTFKKQENHFCNETCRKKYLKANRKPQEDITNSAEYKEWRLKVYKRDEYRCKNPGCNSDSRDIHAHHIYKKRNYPHLAFDVNNGITLCRPCHENTYNREEEFIDLFVRVIQTMNN